MILHLPHAFFHIFVIDIVKPHFFDPITRLYRPALRMHEKAAKENKGGMLTFCFLDGFKTRGRNSIIISLFYRIVLSMINEFIKLREFIWQINFNLCVLVLFGMEWQSFFLCSFLSRSLSSFAKSRFTTKHDK